MLPTDPVTVGFQEALARAAPGRPRVEALLNLGQRLAGYANDEALAIAAQALVEACDDGHRARAWAVRTEAYFYSQNEAAALEASHETQRWAASSGERVSGAAARVYRGMILAAIGDLDRAIPLFQEAIALLSDPEPDDRIGLRTLSLAWGQAANIQANAGHLDEAIAGFQAAYRSADRLEFYAGWPGILGPLTELLTRTQRWDEAKVAVERGKSVWRQMEKFLPGFPGEALVNFYEQRLLARQGLPNRLRQTLDAYHRHLDLSPLSLAGQVDVHLTVIQGFLDTRQPGKALALIEQALAQTNLKSYQPQLLELKARSYRALRRYNLEAQTLRLAIDAERAYGAEQAQVKAEKSKMAQEIEAQFRENAALAEANRKIDGLLLNLLPAPVIGELKASGSSPPREFPQVGILVGDIVGFSTLSKTLTPADLFDELNELFGAFDGFVAEEGAQRLKTIGDAYMAVAGILDGVENPARVLVAVAQKALGRLAGRKAKAFQTMRWGLAVGPVTAGIVGTSRYIYDVFGHAVNLAFRLEAACPPGSLCADETVARQAGPGFAFRDAGSLDLKGVGTTRLFVL